MNQQREEKEAAARARMADLAARFLERTRSDLAALRASAARLATGDVQTLIDIEHLAHRMSGTGATLGFETLADCAVRIEQLVAALPRDTMPSPSMRVQLGTAVDALAVELGRLKGT